MKINRTGVTAPAQVDAAAEAQVDEVAAQVDAAADEAQVDVARIVEAVARVQGLPGGDLAARVQALAVMANDLVKDLESERQAHAAARGQVEELQPLAEMGRAYRTDLIDQAIEDGIRAQGANFPIETYRGLLANADIETIKAIRAGFQTVANDRLPVGRQTNTAAAPAPAVINPIPDQAFAA